MLEKIYLKVKRIYFFIYSIKGIVAYKDLIVEVLSFNIDVLGGVEGGKGFSSNNSLRVHFVEVVGFDLFDDVSWVNKEALCLQGMMLLFLLLTNSRNYFSLYSSSL